MKRITWTFITVLGCSVADQPQPEPNEGRKLSDFDPAQYEVIAIADVEEDSIFLDVDGERVELTSVVDVDYVVRSRGEAATDGEQVGIEPGASSLAAEIDPQLICPYQTTDTFVVPKYEWVWTCIPSGGGIPLCSGRYAWVNHNIICENSCINCGSWSCHDNTNNTNSTTPPALQYRVDHDVDENGCN